MPFSPRVAIEIHKGLLARTVAQSELTDVEEGGEINGALGAVSQELELIELRAKNIRDAFDFANAGGVELDERMSDFPGDGLTRIGKTAASGNCVQITRTNSTGALLVPDGTVYGRTDDTSVLYVQEGDVTIPAGQLTYPNSTQSSVPVVCAVLGKRGNAAAGVIDTLVSGPDGIATIESISALTNATDRETDAEFIVRGFLYLSSLARTMPKALEYLALSFRPSDGSRIKHAQIFEDPSRPGYAELVVDASYGVRKASASSQVVPLNGVAVLFHEYPATGPITNSHLTIAGAPAPLDASGLAQWTSVHERGELYPEAAITALLTAGVTWQIADFNIYTGAIAELQAVIEGNPASPLAGFGYRPSGGRVVVSPPTISARPFSINIVTEPGVDNVVKAAEVKADAIAFSEIVRPGKPLYHAALTRRLMTIPGIVNITFNATMADGLTGATTEDAYPESPRHAVRITAATIEVT